MSVDADKRVVITGATRGLGRAMADAFTNLGWAVAGCGRDASALAELQERYPDPHLWMEVDLGSETSRTRFAQRVLEVMGAPDLLLNNGAMINASAPLWEVGEEEFSQLIDINIKGVASLIRHLVPAMIERGSGVIVNFSSGWGRSTSPEVAPYCASKWAVEGLSMAMAQELPRGLAVAAMNPGIINTAMLQKCFGVGANAYPDATEWARRAVPYLAGLDASCNGKALTAPA